MYVKVKRDSGHDMKWRVDVKEGRWMTSRTEITMKKRMAVMKEYEKTSDLFGENRSLICKDSDMLLVFLFSCLLISICVKCCYGQRLYELFKSNLWNEGNASIAHPPPLVFSNFVTITPLVCSHKKTYHTKVLLQTTQNVSTIVISSPSCPIFSSWMAFEHCLQLVGNTSTFSGSVVLRPKWVSSIKWLVVA